MENKSVIKKIYDDLMVKPPKDFVERRNELLKQIKIFNDDCRKQTSKSINENPDIIKLLAKMKKEKLKVYKEKGEDMIVMMKPSPAVVKVTKTGAMGCMDVIPLTFKRSGYNEPGDFISIYRDMKPSDVGANPKVWVNMGCISKHWGIKNIIGDDDEDEDEEEEDEDDVDGDDQ
jgi:hypothetical protein